MTGKQHFTIPTDTQFKWAAVDLDGTIAEQIWSPENPTTDIGPPMMDNVMKLWELVAAGYKISIYSARPYDHYEGVEQYLVHYGIPFRRIFLGKVNPSLFVDDKAINARAEMWLPDW